ncbi:metalloregulator ArsR/SmtB family transcription factor [Salinibacterium sp. SWN248]|uniref:metalloregulator ArsR/SmtB family transcription factor n=1 Tax=Salinibacterium sp. SWN248 TaxID=2792056 RepID=UPI0018CD307B|nr:metalloregulator ArsR/SmtB family transcription factor [Salinibacterium sp. SWN248]MBH0024680.1 metalloregulator ArsR/SmtB family transcription factor [Salinibacterium sp. SWN248]
MPATESPASAPESERAVAERIAQSMRAIADPTRVQILRLIMDAADGRRGVTDLAARLGLTQPTVSHHVRIMATDGILQSTQEGRQVWYSLVPSRLADVFDFVQHSPSDASPTQVDPAILARITDDLALRFTGVFSRETVAEYVASSYELLRQGAPRDRHLSSHTSRFAADRLGSLAEADAASSSLTTLNGRTISTPIDVLFVCVQNAGRSQLAAAILRSLAGDRVRVLTAGSQPTESINPKIVAALDEIGVSVDGEYPKPLTDEVVRGADIVITMGCGDACPIYPGRRYLDWELPDPADMAMDGVRAVRDDVDARVRELLRSLPPVNAE